MTEKLTAEEKKIYTAAVAIAGTIFGDTDGTLEHRLETAIACGNLASEDRDALRLLLDAVTGITSDLMDSDTAETIREATVAEAIESAMARPEGHILVDGRRCYVAL
jgi:hypothetical protein